jgi:hypothetical protein
MTRSKYFYLAIAIFSIGTVVASILPLGSRPSAFPRKEAIFYGSCDVANVPGTDIRGHRKSSGGSRNMPPTGNAMLCEETGPRFVKDRRDAA